MSRPTNTWLESHLDETGVLDRSAAALASAKDRLVPLALDAKERIVPLAAEAREHLIPLALDAKERLVPLALDAKERLVPLALDARERLAPLAVDARERIVPLVHEAAARARPVAVAAVARVGEVVETEVKPRLADLLEDAKGEPQAVLAVVAEDVAPVAAVGAVAAVAAKPKWSHRLLKALVLAALVGVAAWVAKTMLGRRDDGWELADDDAFREPAPEPARVAPEPAAPAQAVVPEPPAPPAHAEPPAPPAEPDPTYGEGAYVGDNPPEGYVIKGNAQSMKYHVPGALAYHRCVPEVWFATEEAAQRAGFTPAKR
ncbi:MAG: hypothetical protein FWC46_02000, partial [Actinomycetia bacterium]|nr:hypothetical protein [Actinomycetes bacterium]